MIRVLVAAESEVVRAGLETLVATFPGVSVVGSVHGAAPAGEPGESPETDVVLAAPDRPGDEGLGGLLAPGPGPHSPAVVLLVDDAASVAEALRAGARGVLSRRAPAEEIAAAITAAAAGLVVLDADSATRLPPGPAPRPLEPPGPPLTPRELEVLAMLAEGLANKTIAWRMGISEHTVKFHVSAICGRLGASGRTEAVAIGLRLGLIMV